MKVLSVINNDKDAVTKEYVDSKAGVTAVDPTSGPVETDFFIPTKTSELTNDSGFITEAALATKQDTLVSGTNIKTINNESLLGSGNITIEGGSGASVWGNITGTLADQTDLYNELLNRVDKSADYGDDTFGMFVNDSLNGIGLSVGDVEGREYGKVNIDTNGVKINGLITPTNNKDAANKEYVDSVIPTKTSDLTNDSGFITTETDPIFTASAAKNITSTDITNWNNKSDFSGSYNDLTDKPTIPDSTSDLQNDSGFITSTEAGNTYALKSLYGDTAINVGRKANTTTGYYSTAEGESTTASAEGSHAEGSNTVASNYFAHAEGWLSTASGHTSHAEGNYTTASGAKSHAEGYYTKSSGKYSHAEGDNTEAKGESQHVSGKYNIIDNNNTYAEIIGNGTSSTRSNARTLDWSGNEVLAGSLTINSNQTVATTSDIPTKVSDLTNDSGFIDNTYHDSTKQNTLVSGTNIKTINNQTLLGSGNITIEGTINELTSPVILNQLSDGYYRLPSGCVVYSMTGDSLYTIEKSALLSITNNVVSGNDITTYWIIEDDTSFEVNSNETIISDPNVNIKYGVICEDTGDEVRYEKSLSDFITSETDPVFSASAAHGITSTDITNWNSKQPALVSGTNIKTINNQSILGSGNIEISGSGNVQELSSDFNAWDLEEGFYRTSSSAVISYHDDGMVNQDTLPAWTRLNVFRAIEPGDNEQYSAI